MDEIASPVPIKLGPGYFQFQFHTLKQFINYMYSDMLLFESYVWRGHRNESWKLEPTLDRLIRKSTVSFTEKTNFVERHLEAFKYAARGRRGANPVTLATKNEWWALGQHHGLSTPLLDWSHSPFVAAFFAFSSIGDEQTDNRAVFALHQPSVEQMARMNRAVEDERREIELGERRRAGKLGLIQKALLESKATPELEFVRPMSDENSRLVSQRGLFTRNHTKLSIEDWVMNQPEDGDEESYTLIKLLIPDSERAKCLQLLNRMNINPLSLFPDLSGASQYCTLLSQIESY
jgi:hypothetical protein